MNKEEKSFFKFIQSWRKVVAGAAILISVMLIEYYKISYWTIILYAIAALGVLAFISLLGLCIFKWLDSDKESLPQKSVDGAKLESIEK